MVEHHISLEYLLNGFLISVLLFVASWCMYSFLEMSYGYVLYKNKQVYTIVCGIYLKISFGIFFKFRASISSKERNVFQQKYIFVRRTFDVL